MRQRIGRFGRDRQGSVAVMSAAASIVLMGFAAFGIDLGKVSLDRRKAQSTADLAALAAASDLMRAPQAARATVASNNLPDPQVTVEVGTYAADPAVPPPSRFRAGATATANAARVVVETRSDLVFGRILTGQRDVPIRTEATAATTAFAAFAIGSRLAALDGGLLNSVTGALLGTTVSLSVMDYQALADARIDLFQFMPDLARRAQITAGTYDQLLASNVKLVDVVGAMAAATLAPGGLPTTASRALDAVSQSLRGSGVTLPLRSLVDVGPYRGLPVGQAPAAGVSLAALDMLTATAQIANGGRQVEAALGLSIPGLASASLKLAIGERPVGTSWVTVGQVGASVHTAQTRLLLTVRLAGGGSLGLVNVPIYLELASATARLTAVQCGFPDASWSSMSLAVTPAVIDAWIGDVGPAQFANFRVAPSVGPAPLVSALLVQVTGRAHVTITNMAPETVSFSMAEIVRRTRKTVGTRDFTRSLLTRLVSDLDLDVQVLGLGLGLPGGVEGTVTGLVSAATPAVDQLLGQVLAALGLSLGQAEVWATGLRCDGAVLVN